MDNGPKEPEKADEGRTAFLFSDPHAGAAGGPPEGDATERAAPLPTDPGRTERAEPGPVPPSTGSTDATQAIPGLSSPGGGRPLRPQAQHGSWGTMPADGHLAPGSIVFGKYLVIRQIGRGGMGSVWLVRQLTLDVDRALKLIVATIAHDSQARARFLREAQVMARFSHPNAVAVHDAALTDELAYIEMDYVEGLSLDRLIERGKPMPLEWTASLLKQLCEALQEAHDRHIVHRDLKPSNLMLVDGRPPGRELFKVLDFGIAKILEADEADDGVHTRTNAFLGTPPYTSPEQAEGKADARSDLYSTGVILYELLTGFRPYSGHAARMIADTLQVPPPSFATINPEAMVPTEAEQVVMRCLAKDPAARYQTARELSEAFLQAAALPVAEVRPIPSRHGPVVAVATGAAAAGLMAVGVVAYFARGGNSEGLERPVPIVRGGESPDPSPRPDPTTAVVSLPEGYRPSGSETSPEGLPRAIERTDDGARFVLVPGRDDFAMGGIGAVVGADPPPVHTEAVPSLFWQDSEVTNGQLARFFDAFPEVVPPETWTTMVEKARTTDPANADQYPASGVTHDLAGAYARWVGGRLPTEAEWEYAARSQGRDDRPFVWPGDSRPVLGERRANLDRVDDPGIGVMPIKALNTDQTEQGLFDMIGNVREWCRDTSPFVRPDAPETDQFVVRGGSYHTNADLFSTTAREILPGDSSLPDLGFRVVIEAPRPSRKP